MINNLINENIASIYGGGVYNYRSSLIKIINSTIIRNFPDAIYNRNDCTAKITSSIVWDNSNDPLIGTTNVKYSNNLFTDDDSWSLTLGSFGYNYNPDACFLYWLQARLSW